MSTPPRPRYHHLDALRAFAMLLGIVLHALLSFIAIPIWPAQDIHQNSSIYGFAQHAIHGFRMPLFFLISGFFTAMLWRRRGLAALIVHRLKRIFLPMVLALPAFVPPIMVLGAIGGGMKKSIAKEMAAGDYRSSDHQRASAPLTLHTVAGTGDLAALDDLLGEDPDLEAANEFGLAPLAWATLHGQPGAVARLLEKGADVNVRDANGATPLHSAAFLGRLESARLLVEGGAHLNAKTNAGDTPLNSAVAAWGIVEWVADALDLEVERAEVEAGRASVVAYLTDQGAKTRAGLIGLPEWTDGLIKLYSLGAMFPLFYHLWFLYYLLWLVGGFVLIASIVRWRGWKPLPGRLLASPLCLLWLVPLTFLPQYFMRQSFGPDTATGLLPWPPKLVYYAIFFGFGALCHGRREFEERAGRWWPLYFLAATGALVLGLNAFEARFEARSYQLASSLCAVLYAWLMIFGCTGFFRRFFSTGNPLVRYLSDASYWIYLAHLPLVIALQLLIMRWNLPSVVKLLGICLVTYAVLLILYEHIVRYTPVGTLLNGRKVRVPKLPKESAT